MRFGNTARRDRAGRVAAFALALAMLATAAFMGGGILSQSALAESTATDPSPAIRVARDTVNSVVGIITNDQTWDPRSRSTSSTMVAQGSGVVIREGGYILTNYHVIESGSSFQVLMPGGDKVDATIVGSDSATDLAVLKVGEADAAKLKPVTIGQSSALEVGGTVIAIGNPGGEVLANTVTQGIVSALERSVEGSNTTRAVAYIQHDAAINSGNSGGGLFNYRGELVGINTLKYSGSVYSTVLFEGLGFAIPVETATDIAGQLIEHGKVIRPALGVTVVEMSNAPDEPMDSYPPKSVMVYQVNPGSAAEKAGLKQYDFIYEINGARVGSIYNLTAEMDKYQPGDTVKVTVVRYGKVSFPQGNAGYDMFGGYSDGGMAYAVPSVSGGYQQITVDVTLQELESNN
ncbi:MAG: PDZ domain-containing protein [Clostridiales bacterium]|nr:PDZ domain-containing protein [Clostridiales bacterium]